MTIKIAFYHFLKRIKNFSRVNLRFQLTFFCTAYLRKKTLHGRHEITPQYEYIAGAPQILHSLGVAFFRR
jgi:hypothetical protein